MNEPLPESFVPASPGVAAWGKPGIVAFGSVTSGAYADIAGGWFSPDGKKWQPIPDPGGTVFGLTGGRQAGNGIVGVSSVVAWGSGFVAVGGESAPVNNQLQSTAAVWLSGDGLHWSRLNPSDRAFAESGMGSVVSFGGALLAEGSAGPYQDKVTPAVVLWRSTDGVHWQRQPAPSGLDGATIITLVVHGSTLLAAGTSAQAGTAVWVSTDGSHWNTTLVAADSFRGLLNGQDLVVFGDHRASTTDSQDHPVLWASPDANSWTTISNTGLPSGQFVSPLGTGGGHYLAGGLEGGTATLWTSSDGSQWTQAQLASDVFPPGTGSSPDPLDFGVLLPMGGGIILLGGVPLYPRNSPTFQPTAWLWAPAG